jgi:hypothetical protein
VGEWMDLEIKIWKLKQTQKAKYPMFLLICAIYTLNNGDENNKMECSCKMRAVYGGSARVSTEK